MHEIVTLQFGQKANFLATHFWNTQESYFTYATDAKPSPVDHDIHFRAGLGTDGTETYTPRTIIYDFKSNYGNLRKQNSLYDDITNDRQPLQGLWDTGRTVTQRQEAIAQTQYQRNLDLGFPTTQLYDKDIRYWSDFNRVFYHPRSIVQLSEYSLNAELRAYENWQSGIDLWKEIDHETDEGVLDRDVRLFVEECDQLQGFQVFSAVDDLWGGFASQFVNSLVDEFGKKSIWVWGVEDGQRSERQVMLLRAANVARSLSELAGQVSAYVRCSTRPSALPSYFHLGYSSLWQSTAAIEAALESVTLPMRLRGGENVRHGSMGLFEHVLNTNGGQRIFNLAATFQNGEEMKSKANGSSQGQRLREEDQAVEATIFDVDYTPSFHELTSTLPTRPRGDDNPNHDFAQIQCDRGHQKVMDYTTSRNEMDTDQRQRRRMNEEAIVEQYRVPLSFSNIDTFPNDMIRIQDREGTRLGWNNILVKSGLTCTSSTKRTIFELRDIVTRSSRILDVEDREDLYNGLTEVGEQYSFGWEDDSDGDDEDE